MKKRLGQALFWKASVKTVWGAVLAMLVPAVVLAQAAKAPPVAMFVVSPVAESGFVDAKLKDRLDSTKDLLLHLDKKTVRVVQTREEATIVVEVLGRSTDESSTRVLTREPWTGSVGSKARTQKVVVAKLTVGDYSTDLIGINEENDYSPGYWSLAAARVAGQIEKWIKDNRAQLTQVSK